MEERKNILIEQIIAVIQEQVNLQLSPEAVEELLAEIQREQMKSLVYQAFLAVQRSQGAQLQDEEQPAETK